MSRHGGERRAALAVAALVAGVAFLPFLRPALAGEALFFRDLSRQFFPLRRFAVEGLRQGELRHWNPLLHEGVPLHLPAVGYPLDLLQALLPDEAGFSLLLAAHVPLAALGMLVLARQLGCGWIAASGGALAYALGGFMLSTLNLYIYVQAAAWAPLVILALMRAADSGGRWIAWAAAATAVAASTIGAEVVLQAVAVGVILALRPLGMRRFPRVVAALALGGGLAAPVLLPLASLVWDSARAQGLAADVAVAHSLHPLSLPQLVIAAWHGNPADLVNQWWGSNFFPQGFPYILSLYLGAPILALALVGARFGRRPAALLAALLAAALVFTLGRWVGLAALAEAAPALRVFRFPVKAFFTVHTCCALLAALGLDALFGERGPRAWRLLAGLAGGAAALLLAVPALPGIAAGPTRWFLEGFLPPSYSWERRVAVAQLIGTDAALGGLGALLTAGVALLVLTRRLPAHRAAAALAAVAAGDLLRAGAGLNPTVTRSYYALSPEMQRVAAEARSSGGRVFSCDPEASPAYFRARRLQSQHDVWTFAAAMETLTPAFNVSFGVPTALSRDLTMLVPESRVLTPEELEGDIAGVLERLRGAGVSRLLCLGPLTHPGLVHAGAVSPRRIAPLVVQIYDLPRAPPLREVAREVLRASSREQAEALWRGQLDARGGVAVEGEVQEARDVSGQVLGSVEGADRISIEAQADGPTVLLVRDAYAPGWSASVNGARAAVLRANGRHRAVAIGPGHSSVVLSYDPPGLLPGLALGGAALCITVLLASRG